MAQSKPELERSNAQIALMSQTINESRVAGQIDGFDSAIRVLDANPFGDPLELLRAERKRRYG